MAYGFLKVGVPTLGLCFGLLVSSAGCRSDAASAVTNAKLPDGVRSQVVEHEACDEAGNKVEVLDANNDGKPDIRKVSKGGREVCRITDLNHDGKPDMFEYFDASGQLRRREADYDDNGIVNSVEHFESGKLVRRELDTTNQGRIDTWDFFDPATGARSKRERDATGDGKVDQWWIYEGERVTIATDRNGDGQPDPGATIVLGANGQAMVGDAGALATTDAAIAAPAAAPPPPQPTLPIPGVNGEPAPPVTAPPHDAGVAGKPQRGGAKR
jgi:hypothetical protein